MINYGDFIIELSLVSPGGCIFVFFLRGGGGGGDGGRAGNNHRLKSGVVW